MTKSDFFRVLIKVFALYSIILTVFSWIPSNLMYSFFELESLAILGMSLLFTFLSILIYVFLIRKTDFIIDFLKIDRGFEDDEIKNLNFNSKKILMLGVILIGGFLIISEASNFISYSFLAFKSQVQKGNIYLSAKYNFGSTQDYIDWALSAFNLFIGYLLISNYLKISNWLYRKEKITD